MANIYRSIGRSMVSRYAIYASSVISLMVLARLFKPEIFGIVAAAQTVVIFFQLVSEGGISPAIIGLDKLSKKDRDGIFGLSLFLAFSVAVLMLFLTSTLVNFYKMAEVRQIVPYVALALLANTASVLPLALLQRQQYFKRIAQAGIIAELGALAGACFANLYLTPLISYAIYFPAKAALNFSTNWYYSKETEFGRPMPGWGFSAIKPLLRTTGFQLGFNFINYFSRNLDNVLVGKFLGAGFLGIYDRSYQLMRYPLMLLTFAMTPAIQPALRGNIDDVGKINILHRDLAFKLSSLGSVAALIIFFFSKYIVFVAFGEHWSGVVPIVRLLALIIPVQVVLSTSGSFFQAFNRTDLMFSTGVLWSVLNVAAIIFGIWWGTLESLCWGLFISFHVNFLQIYYFLHKQLFGYGYSLFLKAVWPIPFAVIIMILSFTHF